MALTNDQITAQNFKDFYGQIRPYLNGQVPTFANQFSRSDLYSTNEKIIGQWIDGKPLYQKSYVNVTVPAANSDVTVESNFNVDTFWVSCLGMAVPNEMAKFSDGLGVFVFIRDPDGHTQNLAIGNTSAPRAGNKAWFTICYTKSTDSAIKVGTGTDYSTEEQVIGTWIDGKPLYQKSYTGTWTIDADSYNANIADISFVDTLVDVKGTGYDYGGGSTYGRTLNSYTGFGFKNGNNLGIQSTFKMTWTSITIQYTKNTD